MTVTTFPVTIDGAVRYYDGAGSFSSIRAQAVGTDVYDTEPLWCCYASGSLPLIGRSFFSFDTSAIGDTDDITDAKLRVYGTSIVGTDGSVCLVAGSQATGTLTTAAYNKAGSTQLATAIPLTAWNTSGYNEFTLNAAGLALISKTGLTKLALIHSSDQSGSAPAANAAAYIHYSEASGSSTDPELVVTYSAPATVSGSDSAAGTDSAAVQVTVQKSGSDSATGTDAAAVVAAVGQGGSTLLNDQMTAESTGVALESHTPDSGGTWARVGGTDDAYPVKLSAAGRAYASCLATGGAVSNAYEHSVTIADGTLEFEIERLSGAGGEAYFGVRKGTDGGGYNVIWVRVDNGAGGNAGRVTLQKRVAGTITTLGTPYDIPGYANGTYRFRLYFQGSDIRLSRLIASTWTEIITATVADLTTGKTGLWLTSSGALASLGVTDDLHVNYLTTTAPLVGRETAGSTEGATVTDASLVQKSASDSGAVTDAATVKAIIDPTGGTPGSAPSWYSSQQTIWPSDIQNAPGGSIECLSGKMLFFTTASSSHVGSGSIVMKTAASEAAANAGTFSSATTIVQESYPYYYGYGGATRIEQGAHAGRVWVAFARANLPSGTHLSTQLIYTDDEGATWSLPQTLPDPWTDWIAGACASPIVEMPNGDLVIAMYGRNTGQNAAWCKLMASTDAGANWSVRSTIIPYTVDLDQAEPALALVTLANGQKRLVCAANRLNQSLSYATSTIVITYSDDGGYTWPTAADCGLGAGWGGAPAILQGADLAVYLLLRNTGATAYQTYYSRSTNYGAAGSFTASTLIYSTGSMRYGEFLNLASGRMGVCFATETSVDNAALYWRTLALNPATGGHGIETTSTVEGATVQVGVGSIPKTASDAATATDTASVAKTVYKTAGDTATATDSSGGLPTVPPATFTRPFLAPLDVFDGSAPLDVFDGSAPLDMTYTEAT